MMYRYAVMARCRKEGALGAFKSKLFVVESPTKMTDDGEILSLWIGQYGPDTGKPHEWRYELYAVDGWREAGEGENVTGVDRP